MARLGRLILPLLQIRWPWARVRSASWHGAVQDRRWIFSRFAPSSQRMPDDRPPERREITGLPLLTTPAHCLHSFARLSARSAMKRYGAGKFLKTRAERPATLRGRWPAGGALRRSSCPVRGLRQRVIRRCRPGFHEQPRLFGWNRPGRRSSERAHAFPRTLRTCDDSVEGFPGERHRLLGEKLLGYRHRTSRRVPGLFWGRRGIRAIRT